MDMKEEFNNLMERLKTERDALKVQAHLASMEARDEFAGAEEKWEQLKLKVAEIGDDIDTTKVIEIKVNGSLAGYPTTVANALSSGYLINNGTTYSIDLTKFNASSSIIFTYYAN